MDEMASWAIWLHQQHCLEIGCDAFGKLRAAHCWSKLFIKNVLFNKPLFVEIEGSGQQAREFDRKKKDLLCCFWHLMSLL